MKAWIASNPGQAAKARARVRAWRLKNPEKKRAQGVAYFQKHRERCLASLREWNAKNPESARARSAKHAANNREKRREQLRQSRAANPGRHAAWKSARRARERNATPPWVDLDAIAAIYAEAARIKMTVDHVVPLTHPLVCGLHVPWNLQLLSHSENSRKCNRFDEAPGSRSIAWSPTRSRSARLR